MVLNSKVLQVRTVLFIHCTWGFMALCELTMWNCSSTFAADFPTGGKESAGSGIHSQLLQFSNWAPFTLQSLGHQCFLFFCLSLFVVSLARLFHFYVRKFHLSLWNCSLCELQPVSGYSALGQGFLVVCCTIMKLCWHFTMIKWIASVTLWSEQQVY